MSSLITVKEHQPFELASSLDQSEIDELTSSDSVVFIVRKGKFIAANFVGILTTRRGTVIEILPKFDLVAEPDDEYEKTRAIFLSMLRHWRGKGFKKLTESHIRSLRNFPMLEVFVYLFLSDVREIVRRGLARQYVQLEDNLTYLRGRLLFSEHIRENLVDQSRFYVSHDEFSENRPANRLIHKVLKQLDSRVSDLSNFQNLQQLKVAFADIPPSENVYADWQSHNIDRSMEYYESVMQWVRLFLFNEGLTTFTGKHENVSLLFPMEEVFEDFVTNSFKRYQDKYSVRAQGPPKNLATKNGHGVFYMKPDISLMSGNTVHFILDAKWKAVDATTEGRKNNINQHDMYQLYAYGKNYKCKAVALVFPKTSLFIEPFKYKFADSGLVLLCFPFDVKHPESSVRECMTVLDRHVTA